MIQLRIASLALDSGSNQPVIVLRPLEDETPGENRVLPIWIGHPEATAILLALEGIELPRPLTHDLMKSLIETLGAGVERVEIVRFDQGTFFATIELSTATGPLYIDARPSDSIALAVRAGAPIFVADDVFSEVSVPDESGEVVDEEAELEAFREFLDAVDPEDFKS
ncbi:MAG: bifunctional nuclease family protein [Coriobacteriia bacterium]|nr:bifunctional nuclease family protein [Coriobacteriia bacterium]